MGRRANLIIDDSERNSDLIWASGFVAGDPFIYVELESGPGRDRSTLILSDLEYGRAQQQSRVDEVLSFSTLEEAWRARTGSDRMAQLVDVAMEFLHERGVEAVRVPSHFPVKYADELREHGFQLEVEEGAFFPDRVRKTPAEIDKLQLTQSATESVMLDTIDRIRRSEVRDGELFLSGEPLTAEALKRRIRNELLMRDCVTGMIIVAPGDQGCDPHCAGTGPLRASESIIIDIFPQHINSRYWGDMTRTVVKGEASPELIELHEAVCEAQDVAFRAIRPGADVQEVHSLVQESLRMRGHVTERRDGQWVGFFHGTGHGVGLDIHEDPRITRMGEGRLEAGMVLTVEPGLYYPGLGGVRIEDLVVVTAEGCRSLNSAGRDFIV